MLLDANPSSTSKLSGISFGFEERLQETLASNPNLLDKSSDIGGRLLLGRELAVKGEPVKTEGPVAEDDSQDAPGRLDVCFAEQDGCPCIVEAKLYGNPTMRSVLNQALGYAEDAMANPERAADNMRTSLSRLQKRFPCQPPLSAHIAKYRPGWNVLELHKQLAAELRARRCRVVVAADYLPPEIVEEAQTLRPRLGAIQLDLVNLQRNVQGGVSARFVTETTEDYARNHGPPLYSELSWELVPRREILAVEVMRDLVMDRFRAKRGEYRVKRIGALPTTLYFESSPGRAPIGDPHPGLFSSAPWVGRRRAGGRG